jgi:hypothetical protein
MKRAPGGSLRVRRLLQESRPAPSDVRAGPLSRTSILFHNRLDSLENISANTSIPVAWLKRFSAGRRVPATDRNLLFIDRLHDHLLVQELACPVHRAWDIGTLRAFGRKALFQDDLWWPPHSESHAETYRRAAARFSAIEHHGTWTPLPGDRDELCRLANFRHQERLKQKFSWRSQGAAAQGKFDQHLCIRQMDLWPS